MRENQLLLDVTILHVLTQLGIELLRVGNEGEKWTVPISRSAVSRVLGTHYWAIRPELVEMEEALKAGHDVDPFRAMQFWAIVTGAVEARTETSSEVFAPGVRDLRDERGRDVDIAGGSRDKVEARRSSASWAGIIALLAF